MNVKSVMKNVEIALIKIITNVFHAIVLDFWILITLVNLHAPKNILQTWIQRDVNYVIKHAAHVLALILINVLLVKMS